MIGKHLNYNLGSSTCKDILQIQGTQDLSGKKGMLYYNESEDTYYTYNGESFEEFGKGSIPIVRGDDIIKIACMRTGMSNNIMPIPSYADFINGKNNIVSLGFRDKQSFYLEKNKFYDLGLISSVYVEGKDGADTYGGLRLYCIDESVDEVCEYMGMFRVYGNNDLNVTILIPKNRDGSTILEKSECLMDSEETPHVITIANEDTLLIVSGKFYEFNISAGVCRISEVGTVVGPSSPMSEENNGKLGGPR